MVQEEVRGVKAPLWAGIGLCRKMKRLRYDARDTLQCMHEEGGREGGMGAKGKKEQQNQHNTTM